MKFASESDKEPEDEGASSSDGAGSDVERSHPVSETQAKDNTAFM